MTNWIKKILGFKESLVGKFVKTNQGFVFRIEKESIQQGTFELSKGKFVFNDGELVWRKSTQGSVTLSRNNFELISMEEAERLLQFKVRNKLW